MAEGSIPSLRKHAMGLNASECQNKGHCLTPITSGGAMVTDDALTEL
eukprot:CAMPEP_0116859268 /NCGR_PEP_ID=MMETSP0418-20121206/21703_1 /TAXON_ID=1158023 /ORGANISM="Astrosyne radiata, Strain 13vi08-1A" /LENGTH=46 /DNA_ID= /DNA_START= /DNA_END= /DNA_ORIENTATION=